MEKITSTVTKFESDNENFKTIISRFDEVMCEKASKFSIEQLYQNFESYIHNSTFDSFKEQFNEAHKATFDKIKEVEGYINIAKGEAIAEVEKSVKRTFLNLKKSIFGKFSKV